MCRYFSGSYAFILAGNLGCSWRLEKLVAQGRFLLRWTVLSEVHPCHCLVCSQMDVVWVLVDSLWNMKNVQ